MTYKLALLAVGLFVAWMVFFRPRRGVSHPKSEPPPPPQALERCPRCSVYRLPGGVCDCDPTSSSRD